MKSITIHKLDDNLSAAIKQKAKENGISLNKTIKDLLAKSLGIKYDPIKSRKDLFRDLFGAWSDEEFSIFSENTNDMNSVNDGDWE